MEPYIMVQFTELLGHFLQGVVNCSLGFLGRDRDSRAESHFEVQEDVIRAGKKIFSLWLKRKLLIVIGKLLQ
jgi:hypothetical protein